MAVTPEQVTQARQAARDTTGSLICSHPTAEAWWDHLASVEAGWKEDSCRDVTNNLFRMLGSEEPLVNALPTSTSLAAERFTPAHTDGSVVSQSVLWLYQGLQNAGRSTGKERSS